MMSTATALEPWDHSVLYNWLMSLAYHGLGGKRNNADGDGDDVMIVGAELTSKETEVTFDSKWTELPSLEFDDSQLLGLVAWGTDRVIAVGSKVSRSRGTAVIQAWFLDLNTAMPKGWIVATPAQSIAFKDSRCWEDPPRCAVIGNRLYVISLKRIFLGERNAWFRVDSVQLTSADDANNSVPNNGWTTSESNTRISLTNTSAAICVQGHRIIFWLKPRQWCPKATFGKTVVYDTISNMWSTLVGTPPPTLRNEHCTGGVTVSVGSSFLICPHFAEEHSHCAAISLLGSERSFLMADYQLNTEELMHEEDEESNEIPWAEEGGETCDFGGFVSGSSLYAFPRQVYDNHDDEDDDPPFYFVRHDFSTRSCHYDEDDERVWFRPLSTVAFPEPLFPLDGSVMIKVGKWWLCGSETTTRPSNDDGGQAEFRRFQALAIKERQPIMRASNTCGRSNFVHLGLEYYDKCIDTLWDELDDEDGNPPTRVNTDDPKRYLSFLLALDPSLAFERNEQGKLPFQLALENPNVDGRMVRTILRANTRPLTTLNLPHSLFPYIMFSMQRRDERTDYARMLESATDIYGILREQPELVDRFSQTAARDGGIRKRKRK